MFTDAESTLVYHITDVANLPSILNDGRLISDAAMEQHDPNIVIGYDHIKLRRLREIHVPCCDERFVGEFVPFYFCPRSPMLFTINKGNVPNRPAGCQRSIVHLVSTLQRMIDLDQRWAVSSGNAGAFHTTFDDQLMAVNMLDWEAIQAISWSGRGHQKSAELLVADFVPWSAFHQIGCYNSAIAGQVTELLADIEHRPTIRVERDWYYA
ncbi:type II toxin-antitoxin system toxin DNA ADP-ribosyl transferase DarT [Synoicihabitans lomoniglobus]|uniref:DUF4433 domain-containing protein n=1 Tax=Synoicihabitans lomoniglobus TaxID=2909285 RepID=A0AAE9ZWA7_9BACT|nr:DUF4433 domain-containing protein [Opitutaceae bacterium LMO-M01]WED64586.1 DUF4433 domain-containing protein [Opitutaceae bacterium LMO-M01]